MNFSTKSEFKILDENGYLILADVLTESVISDLVDGLSTLKFSNAVRHRGKSVYGVRNLLNLCPAVRDFSTSNTVRQIVENFLSKDARLVRAIYFNKTENANWKVPWHQDLTIALKEKIDIPGFSPWTRKADVWHVQPPINILEKMVALRFHLDDANESNGALRVIPGSHLAGRLSAGDIRYFRLANETAVCRVKKGDCLVMRPLLLHSSSAGLNPGQRRVIHFEFSADPLPGHLEWHES
jgi:ectoine hydroxylase-related dioxygenase (phytanoyl-CoA dioxygenase family)